MLGKILKQTSFAICLMVIAIVFVGNVSAASVLDNTTIVRTGYQTDITTQLHDNINTISIEWIYPNEVKWSTPIKITASRYNRGNFVMNQDDGAIYAMYGVLPYSIAVDVRTDKDVYMLGEPVNMSITVTNNGPNTTSLFPSSQLADFNITNEAGQHIYHWSHDKVFLEEITGISINQSETIELLNDAWSQVDDVGYPVTPGKYYADGWMVKGLQDFHSEIHGERLEITICSGPRSLKRDAICEIEAITPAQKSLQFLINTSIWFINKSLDNELWMNSTHLNPNETSVGIVFDAEMTAVNLLGCVKRLDPTTEEL